MKKNFKKAVKLLFELEGYTSDLKGDPGGFTIFGITSTYFPDIVEKIKKLDPAKGLIEAKKFYKTQFWDEFDCDKYPDKIDILYFCTAVNTPKGQKFISIRTDNFETECLDAIDYYINNTNSVYKIGLVNRVLKIWKNLK